LIRWEAEEVEDEIRAGRRILLTSRRCWLEGRRDLDSRLAGWKREFAWIADGGHAREVGIARPDEKSRRSVDTMKIHVLFLGPVRVWRKVGLFFKFT
jgi:hypothetical protein